jgi:predicted DCC family thiol-disulfide oxidoreductase YuxK
MPSPPGPAGPVVLFDGVCNLCNGAVNFLIDRDPAGVLHFASLQSRGAREVLQAAGRTAPEGIPESILFVENGHVHERSDAALGILRRLPGAWKLASVLLVIPRPLRDLVYRWVARHRYAWFGTSAACRVPTPDLRARFLD